MPAGSASKAALSGAKTVNGPSVPSVSTRPAAEAAATSVLRLEAFGAFSAIVLSAYIAAPPTITGSCAKAETDRPATSAVAASALRVRFEIRFICYSLSP